MISLPQMVQGVEWIWLVWLVAVAIVLKMLARTLRGWHRPHWGELVRGEEGVSYSLSYVLTFPIFFLFACVVFETTWLLLAKIGTMYAAHAGARSQIVWYSAQQPPGLGATRTYQAVWTAMTPFVTGDAGDNPIPSDARTTVREYLAAYQPNTNAPPSTLATRYFCAAARTDCRMTIDKRSHGDVTVTVTYRAPLHIPGAARVLGFSGAASASLGYAISSSATLPNEAPASPDGSLGIVLYYSR